MIRQAVGRAAAWAQLSAALLLALVGVRFGVAGLLYAVREQAPVLDTSAAPAASSSAIGAEPTGPRPPATGVKAGVALRLSLVVTTQHDRAEVLVDGVRFGNTPYVGEVSCKAGERIKIDVLPKSGAPERHELRCAPGTLRIE